MEKNFLIDIAKLRIAIGYLGEKSQYAWWGSSFFIPASRTYLAPVFGKTALLTRYYGMREAATLVHDERIGVGKGVFHLFRLPETIERDLHVILSEPETADSLLDIVETKESAEEFLNDFTGNLTMEAIGPVRIGTESEMKNRSVWQIVAQHFLKAFEADSKSFPFFSEER